MGHCLIKQKAILLCFHDRNVSADVEDKTNQKKGIRNPANRKVLKIFTVFWVHGLIDGKLTGCANNSLFVLRRKKSGWRNGTQDEIFGRLYFKLSGCQWRLEGTTPVRPSVYSLTTPFCDPLSRDYRPAFMRCSRP